MDSRDPPASTFLVVTSMCQHACLGKEYTNAKSTEIKSISEENEQLEADKWDYLVGMDKSLGTQILSRLNFKEIDNLDISINRKEIE